MKAFASICLLSLLLGIPDPQEGTTGIQGVYDMVWHNGQFLPAGELTEGSLEFRPDGTWSARRIYENADPVRRDAIWGGYSVGEEKDGCIQFENWRNNRPLEKRPNVVCDGVLRWSESRWGDAVFRKRH